MNYYTAQAKLLLLAILFLAATAKIFAAEGELDPTFDGDGIVTTDNNSNDEAITDVVVQPDGKILVIGYGFIGSSSVQTAIVRYNPNGSIDTTFNNGGKLITPSLNPGMIALQPDGKIVFVATGGSSSNTNFYISRRNPDGSPDPSFNGVSLVIMDLRGTNDTATSVKVQPDGKIVVGGVSARPTSGSDFALVRLNPDGQPDLTFDGDGKIFTSLGQSAGVADLVVQPDGKIVAAGTASVQEPSDSQSIETFATVRYNPNGSLDTTFDTDALVFTRFVSTGPFGSLAHNRVASVALQSDGKILVGGSAGSCCSPQPLSQIAAIRFNADGSPDSSFGTGGKALVSGPPGAMAIANDLAIQSDNKIVFAARVGNLKNAHFGVARVNPDGSLDTTFSGDGWNIIQTQFGGTTFRTAYAVAIQPNGKIVAGGYIRINGSPATGDFMLTRYDAPSVSPKTFADFDGDGRADISVFRPSDGDWHLLRSETQDWLPVHFGAAGDKITPADFDGDGRTDISVFRDGVWYWLNSSNNSFSGLQFGIGSDVPVPADYTGDGRAEIAVYRGGVWYWSSLTNPNQYQSAQFGIASDKPVPADFDADGKTDLAVYRDGYWYILGSAQGFYSIYFGNSTDRPVVGDYDGDSKADAAVYRADAWHILGSTAGYWATQFGVVTDIPAPADYDGDGKTDLAVFRNGTWYLLRSQQGFTGIQFGAGGDKPVPAAFVP
ncbi:MAG TPA: FG-GAP-like repeat-containing protein [Pyrinomonadaceae bacterium]|jgi:uncharacterized delta-60 repeat protein